MSVRENLALKHMTKKFRINVGDCTCTTTVCNHIFALTELHLLLQFSTSLSIMAKIKCLKVETPYTCSSLISPLNYMLYFIKESINFLGNKYKSFWFFFPLGKSEWELHDSWHVKCFLIIILQERFPWKCQSFIHPLFSPSLSNYLFSFVLDSGRN